MSYGQRQETGRQLCERLVERIGEVAAAVPVGNWPPIADAPSAAFVVALTAWELAPSDRTMHQVSATYEAVIDAWRIAATEYTTEGAA
jgi:hypothetical protein